MCMACYEQYGSPSVINDATMHVASLIDKVYQFSPVAGNAHVVLDDFNIEDDNIEWCLNEALALNIHNADDDQLSAERSCLEELLAITIEERAFALAIHEGWIEASSLST